MSNFTEDDNLEKQRPHYDEVQQPELPTDTARQGPPGRPVLWVLVAALVLAIVAGCVIFLTVAPH